MYQSVHVLHTLHVHCSRGVIYFLFFCKHIVYYQADSVHFVFSSSLFFFCFSTFLNFFANTLSAYQADSVHFIFSYYLFSSLPPIQSPKVVFHFSFIYRRSYAYSQALSAAASIRSLSPIVIGSTLLLFVAFGDLASSPLPPVQRS